MQFLEHDEQVAFFRLAAYRKFRAGTVRDYIYAVPNGGTGGGRQALRAAVRRKAEGLTPGVPDVECFIAVPPYTGLHIEMKKAKKDGGKPSDVSDAQRTMIERLASEGRKCEIGYGAEDAWQKLCSYLSIKP